jgi:hypothetical protein
MTGVVSKEGDREGEVLCAPPSPGTREVSIVDGSNFKKFGVSSFFLWVSRTPLCLLRVFHSISTSQLAASSAEVRWKP